MSRITKTIAEQVAIQLTKKHREELEIIKSDFKKYATELKQATIPKLVLDTFKKYPDYMDSRTSSNANGRGLDRWFSFQHEKLPYNGASISLSDEQADKCVYFTDKISDKKKEIESLKLDIETAVFGLRTYNNVEKEFPEAFKILPKITTTALTVDLKKIRCKLDKNNC